MSSSVYLLLILLMGITQAWISTQASLAVLI